MRASRAAAGASGTDRGADEAKFSEMARILSNLTRVPGVRQARVDAVKALVQSGEYDTDDKLFKALERMLGEILEGDID